MEIADRLAALASKVESLYQTIETEEATKNAFVMPFISTILGYDVFDPAEVIPEFIADVGLKRGEKIDYAIVRDGEIKLLVECKRVGAALTLENASQLFRYFAVTPARVALLTNGRTYQFYTDLDQPNRMDEKPFLVMDLLDIDRVLIPELEKLGKDSFDLDAILNAAGELKYISQLKRYIAVEFREPDPDFVRYFTSKVYDRQFTTKVREQFTVLVQKACRQFLTEQVNDRLATALGAGGGTPIPPQSTAAVTSQAAAALDLPGPTEDDIVTTMDEIEGFQIVRAIVCDLVKPQRIVYRDAKSYCAVLVDDNNRRPLARLHFNRSQRYLGLFDTEKNEIRHAISGLEDIYQFAGDLRASAAQYA